MHPIWSTAAAAARITAVWTLKQLMTPYQLLQQQAGRRGATLQHVDCMLSVGFDTHTFSCVALLTHKLTICSRRSGLAPLSLSGRPTVLGRCVSLRVWSRTQITLALRDCMVLISVIAVLGLLKRSTCVTRRTHSVVYRFDAEPQRDCGSLLLLLNKNNNE